VSRPDVPDGADRRVEDSLVEMTEIVLPEDSNSKGSIFGGRVLALVDKCAAIVALRHARTDVVTAALDSVDFRSGVRVGHVLVLHGRINEVFRSSMEIEVEVHSEEPRSGLRRLTTRAFVTMVSMGPDQCPCPAPRLLITGAEEEARARAAAERRRVRLARRA
jgi:acyl-CoA hydrolase